MLANDIMSSLCAVLACLRQSVGYRSEVSSLQTPSMKQVLALTKLRSPKERLCLEVYESQPRFLVSGPGKVVSKR